MNAYSSLAADAFEWSVGIGSWLSLASIPLILGMDVHPVQYLLLAGIPFIVIGISFTAVMVSLCFLHLLLLLLSLMVRPAVIVGIIGVFVAGGFIASFQTVLEKIDPDSLSPSVRNILLKMAQVRPMLVRGWLYLRYRLAVFLRAADVENYRRAFDTYSDCSPMRSPTRLIVPATVSVPAETGGVIKNEKEPLLHED